MREQAFDLQPYMTHGVGRVAGEIVRAALKNPKENVYIPGGAEPCPFSPYADINVRNTGKPCSRPCSGTCKAE